MANEGGLREQRIFEKKKYFLKDRLAVKQNNFKKFLQCQRNRKSRTKPAYGLLGFLFK